MRRGVGLESRAHITYLIYCLKATNKHPDVLRREGWTEDEISDAVGVTYELQKAEKAATEKAHKQSGSGSKIVDINEFKTMANKDGFKVRKGI